MHHEQATKTVDEIISLCWLSSSRENPEGPFTVKFLPQKSLPGNEVVQQRNKRRGIETSTKTVVFLFQPVICCWFGQCCIVFANFEVNIPIDRMFALSLPSPRSIILLTLQMETNC